MFIKILIILFLLFITIELIFDYRFKNKIKKDFPKTINAVLDETIILPDVEREKNIPRTIYRTYYDLEIAKKFKEATEITSRSNKNLKEIIFDDNMIDSYIKNNYSDRIYKAFKSINPDYGPAKADFFRYLIIYKEGGIYLDIKTSINKNIENELMEDKLLVSKGEYNPYPIPFGLVFQSLNNYNWGYFTGVKNHGEYSNWHFMAPKGNPVLGKVIKQMVSNIEYGLKNKNIYNNGEYSVLALTGPIMFSRTINSYKNKDTVKILNPNLNSKALYCLGFDHKKVGTKKHYSQVKNKKILV